MGIRLIMEAADHALAHLTWRERTAILILAASAIDATRELPAGIEDKPEIIRRLDLGRSERYAVFASLCAKGALLRLERGRNGVKAVYAIASFGTIAGSERPGDPDASPVDNPVKGPDSPDASPDEGSGIHPVKGPENPDPAPSYREFKTGGGTPLPPAASRPLFPFALPDLPPEEGDHPESEKTAPNGPDRQALAAEIVAKRPEWTTRSVLRAIEHPDVTSRPWPIVAEAMRIAAADRATDSPGRLRHPGPWWAEAARRVRGATGAASSAATHEYDYNPETGLCRCKAPQVDKIHRRRRAG